MTVKRTKLNIPDFLYLRIPKFALPKHPISIYWYCEKELNLRIRLFIVIYFLVCIAW